MLTQPFAGAIPTITGSCNCEGSFPDTPDSGFSIDFVKRFGAATDFVLDYDTADME